jgi:hypothetical protein
MAIAPNPLPVNVVPNAAANHGPNWGQWYVEVDVHISEIPFSLSPLVILLEWYRVLSVYVCVREWVL